jgi:hypothetical protein
MNNGNNWRPRLTSGCRNNRRPHSPWTSHFFPRRQIFWIRRLCRPRKFPHRRQAPWNAGGLSTDAREDAVLANGRLARRTSATMATLWPGDGCSASCQIKCGWECAGGKADIGRVLFSRVRGPDAGRGGGVQVAGSAEQWFMVFEVFSFDGSSS